MFQRKVPRPPSDLLEFAQGLRRHQARAEVFLWHLLRAHRFGGLKFRRQHPVEPYVLDFYCAEAKLCIELDGSQHAEAMERDARRDAFLAARGIRVIRIWNDQLLNETESVLELIWQALHPLPARYASDPPPEGGG